MGVWFCRSFCGANACDSATDPAVPSLQRAAVVLSVMMLGLLAPRHAGAIEFYGARVYDVGVTPQSVVAADLDGDGDMDLAVANASSNTVSILRNSGTGTFAAAVYYTVGANPYSVVAVDLDGDGDADLAVANYGSNTVSILRNTGTGAFAAAVPYGVGASPYSVVAADLDGDGDVDLAVANYLSNGTVSILRNSGTGTFAAAVNYGVWADPLSVVAADLDGDGDADLAVVSYTGGSVSILKNAGNGTFTAPMYEVGTSPRSVVTLDLDADGDADLAVANWNSANVSILKNNGAGTFSAAVNYNTDSSGPRSVFAADLDNDGDVDLAVANSFSLGGNKVSILKNNGDGTFTTSVNYGVGFNPTSVFAIDLDRDGDSDLAVANYGSNTVSILNNNGNGTFSAAVNYGVGAAPYSVVAADLDGDGDADLAVANSGSGSVSILKNAGNGTFAAAGTYPVGTSPFSVVVTDLDGDGDVDLAVVNNGSANVSILKNNGNGTFAVAVNYTVGSGPSSVAAADLDGDGDADLAVAGGYGGRGPVSILENAGNGTFAVAVSYGVSASTDSVVAADLDGDGDADLAVANMLNGTVSILINITPSPGPVIASLSPASGLAGTSVVLTGSNFGSTQGTSTVTFNGAAAAVRSWSQTSIAATVPSGATTGPVVVTVNGVASNADKIFTVILDSDNDGMPDSWENTYTLNPNDPADAGHDPDQDGLTNLREYQLGTNPRDPDTDHDGLPDGWEVANRLDPLNAADAGQDLDGDGLTNLQEYQHGTNPYHPDTDGDGVNDGTEVAQGQDPLNPQFFTVALDPSARTVTVGETVRVQITVQNRFRQADTFTVSVSGLNPAWVGLSRTSLRLIPGESGVVDLQVTIPADCALNGQALLFGVDVSSQTSAQQQTASGTLTITSDPVVSGLAPDAGIVSGANRVWFRWTTNVAAVGTLFYKGDWETDFHQVQTPSGTTHEVFLQDLSWQRTYTWYTSSQGACGTTTTAPRTLSISNGVAFDAPTYTFTIERDYDQRASVDIVNTDSVPHTAFLAIGDVSADFVAGFVGTGSQDEVVTLAPGERRTVTLALHAQDATQTTYDIPLRLTADAETAAPIQDEVMARITVRQPVWNLTLTQIASDPDLLTNTYRLTNVGDPLTDVSVTVDDQARSVLILEPQIIHLRMDTGGTITFKVIAQQLPQEPFTFTISAAGGGSRVTLDDGVGCRIGTQRYTVTIPAPPICTSVNGWYCTNRPNITIPFTLPAGLQEDQILKAGLFTTFSLRYPQSAYRNHDVFFQINNRDVYSILNSIPEGPLAFAFPPSYLHFAPSGVTSNQINLRTRHLNGGHYLVNTSYTVALQPTGTITTEVCATSQAEATLKAQQKLGQLACPDLSELSLCPRFGGMRVLDGATQAARPSFNPGDSLLIEADVLNPNVQATAVNTTVSLYTDPAGVNLLTTIQDNRLLNGDGLRTLQWFYTVPADLTASTLYVKVQVQGDQCNVDSGALVPVNIRIPDLRLTPVPAELTIGPGSEARFQITLQSLDGFSGDVTLTQLDAAPPGSTASLSPQVFSLGADQTASAVFTVSTVSTMPSGAYRFRLEAVSGSLVKTVELSVTIPQVSRFIEIVPYLPTDPLQPSRVMQGGTAYRYYTLRDRATGQPVTSVTLYDVQGRAIGPDGLGVYTASIPAALFGNASGFQAAYLPFVSATEGLSPVGIVALPVVDVQINPREHQYSWSSKVSLKVSNLIAVSLDDAYELEVVDQDAQSFGDDRLRYWKRFDLGVGLSFGLFDIDVLGLNSTSLEASLMLHVPTEGAYLFTNPYADDAQRQAQSVLILDYIFRALAPYDPLRILINTFVSSLVDVTTIPTYGERYSTGYGVNGSLTADLLPFRIPLTNAQMTGLLGASVESDLQNLVGAHLRDVSGAPLNREVRAARLKGRTGLTFLGAGANTATDVRYTVERDRDSGAESVEFERSADLLGSAAYVGQGLKISHRYAIEETSLLTAVRGVSSVINTLADSLSGTPVEIALRDAALANDMTSVDLLLASSPDNIPYSSSWDVTVGEFAPKIGLRLGGVSVKAGLELRWNDRFTKEIGVQQNGLARPLEVYDYDAYARSRGKELTDILGSALSVLDPLRLPGLVARWIVASLGGSLLSQNPHVLLTVPPGALAADTEMTLLPISSFPGSGYLDGAYHIGPDETTFSTPATLRWDYSGLSRLAQVVETDLKLYTWDAATDQWVAVPGQALDTAAHVATAPLNHVSFYSLIADTAPPTIVRSSYAQKDVDTGMPTLRMTLTDTGVGVSLKSVTVEFNGSPAQMLLLPGADGLTVDLVVLIPTTTPPGAHQVEVAARDLVGNTLVRQPITFVVDTTPPTTPVVTDGGVYTTDTSGLYATWQSQDPESGIAGYEYSIGTAAGNIDVVVWTSIGTATTGTLPTAALVPGTAYYINVRAINGVGLISAVGSSNGITSLSPLEDPDGDGYTNQSEVAGKSDPFNADSRPVRTSLSLHTGFNLVSFPAETLYFENLANLLEALGGNAVISRVQIFDPVRQVFDEVGYDGLGRFYGPNMALPAGRGLAGAVVYARRDVDFVFSSTYCHTWNLKAGTNLVGTPCAAASTAFQLLQAIGGDTVVSSIQRFNPTTGRFETEAYDQSGQPVGVNFPIVGGEGYFVGMKQDRPGLRP